MPSRTLRVLLVVLAAAVSVTIAHADEKLTLKVSRPVISTRDGVTVRAIVARDARNRAIGIQADSGEFFRSSETELDGERAPRVFELRLHDLPSGDYQVTAVLVNDQGERTTVRRSFQVLSYGMDR
ncbi:MAG: hypothetical protein ABI665_04030 [Vicinamibacterales bacterium]